MTAEPSRLSAAVATALAPGFRFHPTDEELVGYYLKRKVAGRPFRVDAISEIDLYKSEPWDLPGKSRIQSRDMEWYFFCSLDKKYANRSRTNRTTGSGYWKTTGKDRPVRRIFRTVGMKKTLVFHVGRAPKGERTNWVMHEYRLEDEEMARAGITQDAFVVCRIFRKEGLGPQNGAQYGAPLIEEEWEDDGALVLKEDYSEGAPVDSGDSLPIEVDDFQQNQDMGVQYENAALFMGSDVGQQNLNNLTGPSNLIEICQDPENNSGMDRNINMLNGMHENSGATDSNLSLSGVNDEYVELNDFSSPVDGTYSSGQQLDAYPKICNDQNFANYEISYEQEQQDIDKFFNTMNKNGELSESFEMSPTDDNIYFDLSELLSPVEGYPSGEPTDDGMVYFDAPCHHSPADHGSFLEMNDFNQFVGSPMCNSSEPDLVEELIAHFNATENLLYPTLERDSLTFTQSDLDPEVSGGCLQAYETSPQPSEVNGDIPASSSVTQLAGDQTSFKSDVTPDAPDVQADSWNKTFTKRLVSMLGSISSPPAFAAEYPNKGDKSVERFSITHPSSSVRITTGMIQMTVTGNGKDWSVEKNGDVGFFLSYGVTRNALVGNSVASERMLKMSGGMMSILLWNGFNLLVLSVLFFAASYKIGVNIYTR